MNAVKDFFANVLEKIRKMTPKQIVCTVMCVLLITVVVLTCIVIGKVSRIFSALGPGEETTAPTETTQMTEPTTEPTTRPTTEPTTEPTYNTEPGHVHEFTLTESVAASCMNYGYNIYACECGKQDIPLEEQTEPLGHSYGPAQTVAPTCIEDGCTKRTCSRCGDVSISNTVAATGHDYVLKEEVEGTCGLQGHTISQCSVCGDELTEYVGELIEHTFEIVEESTVSCTQDGYTLSKCVNCGEELKENIQTATGHSFTSWTKLPDGSWIRTCLNETCDLVETSADVKIQKDQTGIGHDSSGNAYKLYMIYVGTATSPDMFVYTINDFSNTGTLSYNYDAVNGLIISYQDSNGQIVTEILPIFQSGELTIPAASTSPTPSDPVESTPVETQPQESQPQESTPAESQPQESTPVETTPVETTPVESTPTESTPAESTPAESTPAESTPATDPPGPVNEEGEQDNGGAVSEDGSEENPQ